MFIVCCCRRVQYGFIYQCSIIQKYKAGQQHILYSNCANINKCFASHILVYIYIYIHVKMSVSVYIYVYIFMCIQIYLYIYVYIYIYV